MDDDQHSSCIKFCTNNISMLTKLARVKCLFSIFLCSRLAYGWDLHIDTEC